MTRRLDQHKFSRDQFADNHGAQPLVDQFRGRLERGDPLGELRRTIESQRLPVAERLEELIQAITDSDEGDGMVLLQGEPGSGKSVYSPVAMREALRRLGLPDCTLIMQPRKDAARNVAGATAAVMGKSGVGRGHDVGFSTSEYKETHSDAKVRVVTPGILLRYLAEGRISREQLGAIILDEIHEGSLEYHLILGLVKRLHEQGKAPLILLTSATLNKEGIQSFFGIKEGNYRLIEGRIHPVEVEYQAPKEEASYLSQGAEIVNNLLDDLKTSKKSGDILVFMPGVHEIRELIAQINPHEGVEVLPLHGQLKPEERQDAIGGHKPRGIHRRVIVSTNLAETSLTVPGIRYVVDSCRKRVYRYNAERGFTEKHTEFISKDEAVQRAGRAGRLGPGHCIRMTSEVKFNALQQHPTSEIRHANLSQLVLRLKSMGIEPKDFPFLEEPDWAKIGSAHRELQLIGALDGDGHLTEIGNEMADLSFDPRIARMVVEAKHRDCLEEAILLAAFDRESNVLLGPGKHFIQNQHQGNREAAAYEVRQIQKCFEDESRSDWLRNLNIFKRAMMNGLFEAAKRDGTPESKRAWGEFKKWCEEHHVKAQALTHIAYRLKDFYRHVSRTLPHGQKLELDPDQLLEKLSSLKGKRSDLDAVILSAYPDQIFYRNGRYTFTSLTSHSGMAYINSASAAYGSDEVRLFVASEIMQGRTGRNYAIGVHPMDPALVHKYYPHLVQVSDQSVHYDSILDGFVEETHFSTSFTDMRLGSHRERLDGERGVMAIARALEDCRLGLSFARRNHIVLDNLRMLHHRSGGAVQYPRDMVQWYKDRLGEVSRVSEVENMSSALTLNMRDYYTPEMEALVESRCPSSVNLGGRSFDIEYHIEGGELLAEVMFSHRDWPLLDCIQSSDLPQLGGPEQAVLLTLVTLINGRSVSANDLEVLKMRIDEGIYAEVFERCENNPDPLLLDLPIFEELPEWEALQADYPPAQYATRPNGSPVMAYAGIRSCFRFRGNEYYVEYFASEHEAQDNYERAQGHWSEAQKQRRQEREAHQRLVLRSRPADDKSPARRRVPSRIGSFRPPSVNTDSFFRRTPDAVPFGSSSGSAKMGTLADKLSGLTGDPVKAEAVKSSSTPKSPEPEKPQSEPQMTDLLRAEFLNQLSQAEILLEDARRQCPRMEASRDAKANNFNEDIRRRSGEALGALVQLRDNLGAILDGTEGLAIERMRSRVAELSKTADSVRRKVDSHFNNSNCPDWPQIYQRMMTLAHGILDEEPTEEQCEALRRAAKNPAVQIADESFEETVFEILTSN